MAASIFYHDKQLPECGVRGVGVSVGALCPCSHLLLKMQCLKLINMYRCRNLPDLTFEDFQKVDLASDKYKWIHFEVCSKTCARLCTVFILISVQRRNIT